MSLTQRQIEDALRTVKDPELHRDLVSLGMIKELNVKGDEIALTIELTTPACPLKDQIRSDVWARSREGTRGRLHDALTAQVQGPPDVSANLATAGLEKAIRRTFILELNWYHMRAARLQGAAGPSGSS